MWPAPTARRHSVWFSIIDKRFCLIVWNCFVCAPNNLWLCIFRRWDRKRSELYKIRPKNNMNKWNQQLKLTCIVGRLLQISIKQTHKHTQIIYCMSIRLKIYDYFSAFFIWGITIDGCWSGFGKIDDLKTINDVLLFLFL